MEEKRVKELALQAAKIRKTALEAINAAQSGHVGGSFSVADILTVLYFEKMNIDPKDPRNPDRDRFVLSKGHCTPTMYATLALKGYFPVEDLKTFRNVDSYLSGHVEMTKVPGVDMSAGSLGQGLSAAIGMALAGKVDKKDYRVYAALGDGEIQEGQIWEAAMAAGNYGLDNLTVFVDNNNLQIDGTIEEVMSPYPIDEKFRAFKWNVINIDGHDYAQIAQAIDMAKETKGKPTMIVARTVKGKGVSFMENNVKFHGSTPTAEQFEQAFEELDAQIASLEV
ncbi:MAG TPA: transketolase [Candidatus Dorea gallistercoris]|uniref:Transketolase n=1 Tax=Candidatus Dorea gallistercoris TaxID=2838542 RepID=A0A9D1RC36_9FIRM|nr:transketolase [Candidatus Dorea gallistercoris]